MSNKPRVILHVGGPKTGSTYIQKRLRLAPELLRDKGVYVPILPEVSAMAGNAKLLPIAIDKNASKSFRRAFPSINPSNLSARNIVSALIRDWRKESEILVLSAENFRPNHAQVMRDLLPRNTNYTVKLFIRRQDDWADSYFNQLTKTNDITEGIERFVTRLCQSTEGRIAIPDWHAHYLAWTEAFTDCDVVNFEEAKSNLLERLLPSDKISTLDDYPDLPPEQVSIGVFQIAYLLQLDRNISFADFILHRNAAYAAAQATGLTMKRSLLSCESRRRLRERFEQGNFRLLSEVSLGQNKLEIDIKSDNYCCLHDLYDSKNYAFFKQSIKEFLNNNSDF